MHVASFTVVGKSLKRTAPENLSLESQAERKKIHRNALQEPWTSNGRLEEPRHWKLPGKSHQWIIILLQNVEQHSISTTGQTTLLQ